MKKFLCEKQKKIYFDGTFKGDSPSVIQQKLDMVDHFECNFRECNVLKNADGAPTVTSTVMNGCVDTLQSIILYRFGHPAESFEILDDKMMSLAKHDQLWITTTGGIQLLLKRGFYSRQWIRHGWAITIASFQG